MYVKPKKKLGQHFLKDLSVAQKIAASIEYKEDGKKAVCIEIGPGTGVLTQFVLQNQNLDLSVIEIDEESVEYLVANFPDLYKNEKIIGGDFLQIDLKNEFSNGFPVICGNFPYNISSQIFFMVLDYIDEI